MYSRPSMVGPLGSGATIIVDPLVLITVDPVTIDGGNSMLDLEIHDYDSSSNFILDPISVDQIKLIRHVHCRLSWPAESHVI
jgi:hypothetical protein